MPSESYNELLGLGTYNKLAELQLPLDENTAGTTVVDYSGNGYDGTMQNMTGSDNTVAGPTPYLPRALVFNGSDEWSSHPYLPTMDIDAAGEFSLAVWIKATVAADDGYVLTHMSTTRGFGLYYNGSASIIQIAVNGSRAGGTDSSVGFQSTSWQLVGFSFNNSTVSFYRNGVFINSSETFVPLITDSGCAGSVASRPGTQSSGTLFNGSVANGLMYDHALTADEWAQLYAGPEPLNAAVPTLSIDGNGDWTGTIGTWNSQSNGTLTYAWELRDNSDDSVVDSGSGSSPSGSGLSEGSYYLYVRASNDGGFDAAEDSNSSVQSYPPPGGGSRRWRGLGLGLGIRRRRV